MEVLAVGLIQRYLVQGLDYLGPKIPGYAKVAAAAVLSYISSALGAVHAPAALQQALPGAAPAMAAALAWGATDAIHGLLNFVEKRGAKP